MDKELSILNEFYERATEKAIEWGLEPFPTDFHIVPAHRVYEIASYGVPGHFSHWSYGRDFWKQKGSYDRGHGRIYELVINSNPAQAFLLDTNTMLDNLFVIAHVIGHCYLPGTELITVGRGVQKIEDITRSDTVLNHKNEYSEVIPTSREYSGYIVKLMAGGQIFSQTADHKLLVARGKSATPEWLNASQIGIGDYLVSPVLKPDNSQTSTTVSKVEYLGKQAKRARSSFDIPLNEEVGELIGLYLAEGYSRSGGQCGLCFHTNEVELHERAEYLVRKYFNLEVYSAIDEDTHSYQVLFNNKQIAEFLHQFGRGSHNKSLGIDWLWNTSEEFLRGVLRGYLLGDGHIGDRVISFSTTSPHLAWEIPKIASIFGAFFSTTKRDRPGRKPAWEPRVTGPQSRKLRNILGFTPEAYEINREWETNHFFDDLAYVKVTGKEIEEYSGLVYCVNAENGHSFQLANGCVTHNSDFFANNAYFAHTNRNVEHTAVAAAERFREYEIKYGRSTVEDFIDDCFTIEEHVDPHIYTKKKSEGYEISFDHDSFLDLFPEEQERRKSVELEEYNRKEYMFPQEPTRDVMGFIARFGRLKDWQQDVMSVIRAEQIYLLPQRQTKIMNEGWASIMHHELMHELDVECDPGGIDFADVHSGVLSPRMGQLNPYWLGYNMFKRIIELGDLKAELPKDEVGKAGGPGWQDALEATRIERDETFIRNHLDQKLCDDLDLFSFEFGETDTTEYASISTKDWKKVRDSLVASKANMGMPYIVVQDGDYERTGTLVLKHQYDGRPLQEIWAQKTLISVERLWGRPVILESEDDYEFTSYRCAGGIVTTDNKVKEF